MLESQKKANAKRQAEYRKRHIKEGSDQRLNVILGLDAKLALERMAKLQGVSNKELLERVLLETQSQLIAEMDSEQQAHYYSHTPAALL
jgi:DNA-directed RNA polymerase specialized sigma subunit